MTDTPLRAALYCRVSGDDHAKEGRNLEGQLELARAYAAANNYSIVAEISEDDRGASGAAFELEGLNQVRALAEEGRFDVLVVRDLDRLSRDLAKQLMVEHELKSAGVTIKYVLAEYPDTPEGRLMELVRAVIAEFERLKTRERTMHARRRLAKGGRYFTHGRPPKFGWRRTERGEIVIDEEEAAVVRLMSRWIRHGDEDHPRLGLHRIAKKLSSMGVLSWQDKHGGTGITANKKAGRGQWTPGAVYHILTDPAYKGEGHYGKTTKDADGRRITNPQDHWIAVPLPPILEPGEWDEIQAQLRSNQKYATRNTKNKYLLAGRLRCGECGSRMYARTWRGDGKAYPYYFCAATQGRIQGMKCQARMFRGDRVDASVWADLRALLSDPVSLTEYLAGLDTQGDADLLEAQLEQLADRLADLQVRRERLLDLYLDDIFDKETLSRREAQLGRDIKETEERQAAVVTRLARRTMEQENIYALERLAYRVRGELAQADDDLDMRRQLVELIDVWVVLKRDGEEVVARLHLGDPQCLSIV